MRSNADYVSWIIFLSRKYFYSGWGFLIPYLAAYLLFVWLRWPVSPTANGEAMAKGISESEPLLQGSWVPSLLHVYWALHSLHLALGALALRAWWRESPLKRQFFPPTSPYGTQAATVYSLLATITTALPWLGLGLLFWIPGVYLEWPADPWEHLRRINEWQIRAYVLDHTVWVKSSYLIPYSLLSWCQGLRQLFWLDLYYTGISLLLCWQYYRLAIAIGLGARAAMLFVVVQALLIGNNVFSFYRYYGLSSSIYAQLGAVTLVRFAITFFAPVANPWRHRLRVTAFAAMALPLIIFNHPQALGIAALGIVGVLLWRLFDWKPSGGWLLVGLLLLLCLVPVAWYPSGHLLDSRPALRDWISPWFGFRVFQPGSPSNDQMLAVLGLAGLANLAAAAWLLRRNHLAAWLTLAPFLLVCLPYVALPFAEILVQRTNIVTFQRMYFAVPAGLALACLADLLLKNRNPYSARPHGGLLTLLAGLVFLVLSTPGSPSYNHAWNALSSDPKDLTMREIIKACGLSTVEFRNPTLKVFATDAVASLIETLYPRHTAAHYRPVSQPVAGSLQSVAGVPVTARPSLDRSEVLLAPDPLIADPPAWRLLSGAEPNFVSNVHDFGEIQTALQSTPSGPSEIFTEALIPLTAGRRYRVEMSLHQAPEGRGRALLAVAWYDAAGRFLDSSAPLPQGAGTPAGWINGTYSYFGPVGVAAPAQWTTYRISFGAGEFAAVPANAHAFRVGALLNYPATPGAVLRLTNVRVWEKSNTEQIIDGAFSAHENLLVIAPDFRLLYTPASQAAQLSRHWLPHQLPSDIAGSREIGQVARQQDAVVTPTEGARFYFYRSAGR